MKSDSSSSTAGAGRGAPARRFAQAAERINHRLDAGHDRHALAGRPGHEFLRGGERFVDALHQFAEHAIETLGLLGRQRRGARRFARQRRQVGDERLDLLIELRGELVDALGEADPGEDGADLDPAP